MVYERFACYFRILQSNRPRTIKTVLLRRLALALTELAVKMLFFIAL